MPLQSINPTTGQTLQTYPTHAAPETRAIAARVHQIAQTWRLSPFAERSAFVRGVATKLRAKKDALARLMTLEMGKPLSQSRAELEKCAWVCDFYAAEAEKYLSPETVQTNAAESFVTFSPLGVILAIMPWNFPFWQVFRFAVPAVMAGNTVLLKHAPNVTGCAVAIEELFSGGELFRALHIDAARVDEAVAELIAGPFVQAVTLTGSTRAGKSVAQKAAAAIKKSVLELGGSDPFIVLADADLELATDLAVRARLGNSGQSCIAAKRFIVVDAVRAAFEKQFVEKMAAKKIGDPLQEECEIGPLAREDLRANLHRQVEESVAKGAKILLGGKIPAGPGYFYPATVLTDLTPDMPAYQEELFGPVASLFSARDEQEAMRLANDTPYGLGAAIFSRDLKKAKELASRQIQAGSCFINAVVQSDPRLPFGGIKQSGYGRELGVYGIREFVNIKTISIG